MKTERSQKDGRARSSAKRKRTVGEEIIDSVEQIIAWTRGEDVPVRVAQVEMPVPDVSAIRKRLPAEPGSIGPISRCPFPDSTRPAD